MREVRTRVSLRTGLFTVIAAIHGCSAAGDPQRIELASSELPASAGLICEGAGDPTERCAWQSSDWSSDPWLPYPAQVTLTVPHTLGRVPSLVWVYISFEPSGVSATLAAGDLGRIVEVTETQVTVQNATNGEYFSRIVVQ